jgi:hypothetical protein
MSIGIKLGRFVGAAGALAVHGAERGVAGLGQFGSDVVAGVGEGYDAKAAYLALSPEQRKAQRDAILAERAAPIAVVAKTGRKTSKAGV